MATSAIGVVGTDSYTPLYQSDARWSIWSINDIYLGDEGLNKFVPKVNDYVVEPESGNMFKVASLSMVTFIPELVPVELRKEITVDEIVSSNNSNYRIYFDKSVTPYVLAVDRLLKIHGSSASFARVYKGQFIDPSKIISRRYNNSGVFIGHDIPLELVAFNSHDNYAIKSIPTCNTDQDFVDGEVCTVVVFDSSGKVMTRTTCLLEETTYVAQAYAEQKYITQIFLKSAFISDTTASEITYPVNLPTQSFSPIGVVQYNDGSQIEYPVDGGKFSLFGMEQFVSTIIGHRAPLVLRYRMDTNESGLASVSSDSYYITRPYTMTVSSPNTSYNAKLYVYPEWVDGVNGYRLTGYLTNLDRNIMFDVSSQLSLASNSPSFNPVGYGLTQRLMFSINLANVSGVFNNFQHIQTVDVILRAPASDTSIANIWETASQVPSPGPYYGTSLRATIDPATRKRLTINNNLNTVQEFINKLYTPTNSLYNPATETTPPQPTHIEVTHLGQSVVLPITDYASAIQFTNEFTVLRNVQIVFMRQTPQGYLKLSVAALTIR